jgi:hypothetical protein
MTTSTTENPPPPFDWRFIRALLIFAAFLAVLQAAFGHN